MKRKGLLMLLLVGVVFWIEICLGEFMRTPDTKNTYTSPFWGEDSYAWTEEYLFIARGYENNDATNWVSSYYNLYRVDLATSECVTLLEGRIGPLRKLITYNDRLYIIWESCIYAPKPNPEKEYGYGKLLEMSFDGDILRETDIFISGIIDYYVPDNQKVYLIGVTKIFLLDLETAEIRTVYSGETDIGYGNYRDCFIYGDHLFFQEGELIKAIDTETNQVDFFLGERSSKYEKAVDMNDGYSFMVLQDYIFYFDIENDKMMRIKLDGTEKQVISDNRLYFLHYDECGIIVYDPLESDGGQVLYYSYNNILNDGIIFSRESGQLIDLETLLIGKGRYIHQVERDYELGKKPLYVEVLEVP